MNFNYFHPPNPVHFQVIAPVWVRGHFPELGRLISGYTTDENDMPTPLVPQEGVGLQGPFLHPWGMNCVWEPHHMQSMCKRTAVLSPYLCSGCLAQNKSLPHGSHPLAHPFHFLSCNVTWALCLRMCACHVYVCLAMCMCVCVCMSYVHLYMPGYVYVHACLCMYVFLRVSVCMCMCM